MSAKLGGAARQKLLHRTADSAARQLGCMTQQHTARQRSSATHSSTAQLRSTQSSAVQLDSTARPWSSTAQLDSAARKRSSTAQLPHKAFPTSGLAASERSRARLRVPRRENRVCERGRPAALPACHRLEQVAGVQRPRRSWLAASKGERQHVSRAPAQRAATNAARARQTPRQAGSRKHRRVQAARHQDRGRRCGGVMRRTPFPPPPASPPAHPLAHPLAHPRRASALARCLAAAAALRREQHAGRVRRLVAGLGGRR